MQSVKLSVTVKRHLDRKYEAVALDKINAAIEQWIESDAERGFRTIHVAVDDPAAMQALGATAITGRATASKIKRAIDALWERLNPDYLVLFGGEDIIPMFVVKNPSYDPGGDDDENVPTDNPYASSSAFRSSRRKTYLVPDRVIGRIPDMVSDDSPAWFADYLATATKWKSRTARYYSTTYAICCDSWKGAGAACVRHLSAPLASLFISPPTKDTSTAARTRLKSRMHMIKCHGAQLDPKYYGQKGHSYPDALASKTLKSRVKSSTVAAAMCCYGAQVYSPDDPAATDPGEWPIASTYLRQKALGFVGSTMIAWVGVDQMMCADWVVAGYLKGVLGGASIGRAFLEAKQDYVRWINGQGQVPDIADEKTLIEFVLLGDPSIHPVRKAPATATISRGRAESVPALAHASDERHLRRVVQSQIGEQIRELLPARKRATKSNRSKAKDVFKSFKSGLTKKAVNELKEFGFKPASPRVDKLETQLPAMRTGLAMASRGGESALAPSRGRESVEYYWSGRRIRDGHKQVRLIKVETDLAGNVLRTAVIHSS